MIILNRIGHLICFIFILFVLSCCSNDLNKRFDLLNSRIDSLQTDVSSLKSVSLTPQDSSPQDSSPQDSSPQVSSFRPRDTLDYVSLTMQTGMLLGFNTMFVKLVYWVLGIT